PRPRPCSFTPAIRSLQPTSPAQQSPSAIVPPSQPPRPRCFRHCPPRTPYCLPVIQPHSPQLVVVAQPRISCIQVS
ncbi:hypothetical protein BDN70DRAFT_910432, partial [Pholiota conissans]